MPMRVLVISNLYPPHHVGGYELGCRDVVDGLTARGHDVVVLTSMYGLSEPQSAGPIHRWLVADVEWTVAGLTKKYGDLWKREYVNQNAFKHLCRQYKPDVVYVWNLAHTSISVAALAHRIGLPVCYFIFDYWLCDWESDPWHQCWNQKRRDFIDKVRGILPTTIMKFRGVSILSSRLDLRHLHFASQYLKDSLLAAGKPVQSGTVIHWGIDLALWPCNTAIRPPTKLLYVGQIAPHKGVHTAVEALKVLVDQYHMTDVSLTILGPKSVSGYYSNLLALADSLGMRNHIYFISSLPREQLLPIYHRHDILLFPSVWDEPLGITPLEAMASGLPVVGTATGGSAEMLQHEVNALTFAKADAHACAEQVSRLVWNPGLFRTLRTAGRRTVEERFTLGRMLDRIEVSLHRISQCSDQNPSHLPSGASGPRNPARGSSEDTLRLTPR